MGGYVVFDLVSPVVIHTLADLPAIPATRQPTIIESSFASGQPPADSNVVYEIHAESPNTASGVGTGDGMIAAMFAGGLFD